MSSSDLENSFLNPSEIIEILMKIEGGQKSSENKFFDNSNKILKKYEKLGVLTIEDEDEYHLRNSVTCNVFGCNKTFDTVFAFESHYNTLHRYICGVCKKNLPSSHLLDLHILEQHDSFFAVQAERKPMFSCYIEECDHKSANANERKDHCIRVHKYPSNFRFDQSNCNAGASAKPSGSKSKNNSKLKQPILEMELDSESNSNDGETTKLNENKKFYQFGHQQMKVFNKSSYAQSLAKKSDKKTIKMEISPLENDDILNDLVKSLPN